MRIQETEHELSPSDRWTFHYNQHMINTKAREDDVFQLDSIEIWSYSLITITNSCRLLNHLNQRINNQFDFKQETDQFDCNSTSIWINWIKYKTDSQKFSDHIHKQLNDIGSRDSSRINQSPIEKNKILPGRRNERGSYWKRERKEFRIETVKMERDN